MELMLTRAAREYVNHPRGADVIDGKLIVSSIYEWFKEDFGDSDRGVIEHLKLYAAPELTRALDARTRLDGHDYDWSINDFLRFAAQRQAAADPMRCGRLDDAARFPMTWNQALRSGDTSLGQRALDVNPATGGDLRASAWRRVQLLNDFSF